MPKIILPLVAFLAIFGILTFAFAQRDWEYWSQESLSIPINKTAAFLILPEWRFKDDMQHHYLFKLENGLVFKINKYLEIAPYYVYQEKQSRNMWDRSDLTYLDVSLKLGFKKFLDIKLSNRLRYQYDFDKDKTTLRDSLKVSKSFPIGNTEITPYISEEPFYDAKLDRITEHRSAAGITCNFTKNISLGVGYMLNSKRGTSKWLYTNVLVSTLNIKF